MATIKGPIYKKVGYGREMVYSIRLKTRWDREAAAEPEQQYEEATEFASGQEAEELCQRINARAVELESAWKRTQRPRRQES